MHKMISLVHAIGHVETVATYAKILISKFMIKRWILTCELIRIN